MKGIILAGGSGTRLHPLTISVSKQILPIYDKPMIYYPLSVLMLAGIRDILIISTPRDINCFKELFGNGSKIGLNISYAIQDKPNGLAEAFIIGEEFIGKDSVSLVLGDNIFFGQGFSPILKRLAKLEKGAEIFGYLIKDAREYGVVEFDENMNVLSLEEKPEKPKSKYRLAKLEKGAEIFGYLIKDAREYGVVEFDENMNVLSLEEKPEKPKSKYAIPGLYFYDNTVVEKAKRLKPSKRGELEITDLNKLYLEEKSLKVNLLGRGFAWLDTGNHKNLLQASNFIETIQERQGNYIACLEEIAYKNGWITREDLKELAKPLLKTEYGKYLLDISEEI